MPGRPKKPIALKKLEGTYRHDRDDERALQEKKLQAILPAGKLKINNKEITDKAVKKAYRDHIELLRCLGGAAEQKADSPLLQEAYWCLQEAEKLKTQIRELDVLDDMYDKLTTKQLKLFSKYEEIVKDFYLSPNARIKLRLDVLTVQEKGLAVEEKKSAVASLLEKKTS